MENEELLPKPELDLPLPEKEIPAQSSLASQGQALRSYRKTNILKSKFFLGFVALSFLIAFLVGGFTLGENSANKKAPTPIVTQAPTPTPKFIACGPPDLKCSKGFTCDYCTGTIVKGQPTPKPNTGCVCIPNRNSTPTPTPVDETANWKTYNGQIYSLKYPNDWTTIENQDALTIYPSGYPFTAPGEPAPNSPYLKLSIVKAVGRGVEPIKQVNITIDGQETVKYYESETVGIIKAITTPDNRLLSITFQVPQVSSSTINSRYDQILSAFKFTN